MKMQPMESGKTFVNYISNSVSQSCLTLCNPMDCSPPGSPVHGILQARLLEWVAIPFSRGSSWPRDQIQVSHIAGRFFIIWAIRDNLNCIKNSYYSVANKLPKQSHKIGRSEQTFFSRKTYRWLTGIIVLFFCLSQHMCSVEICIDLRLKFSDHVPSWINSLASLTYGVGEDPQSHNFFCFILSGLIDCWSGS